jgi:cardiolipin synthase
MLIYILIISIYLVVLIYTIVRVLLDTDSTPKTLAYLLIIFVMPVIGIIIYYSVGINYRHMRSDSLGDKVHREFSEVFLKNMDDRTSELLEQLPENLEHFRPVISFLHGLDHEQLTRNNFKLLINGEDKFPEVFRTLEAAELFIHMEYYEWQNDMRGNEMKRILLSKAASGIKVRVLFDDFASWEIKSNIVKELKAGGVEVYPKVKVKLKYFVNRLNHRDHRKLIIVDGKVGFVGGINISDRYDNSMKNKLYWRDSHVKVTGPLVSSMQRHFVVSWNVSAKDHLKFDRNLFPGEFDDKNREGTPAFGQVVAGGPIYPKSNIMLSYYSIFSNAKKKLYITNPYFIPSDSIVSALVHAAVSGVDVRLLVPEVSDSAIVGAASKFYFSDLLKAGVRIYLYRKGFIHAKTVVADGVLSVIGTANMDIRSFDLNFEIMSCIYGAGFGKLTEDMFLSDLEESKEISWADFKKLGIVRRLKYATARLISSFL